MANQITGKILYIYPTQVVHGQNKDINKRSIVIDCTRFDPYTGERGFENTPLLEFIGDRCAELDKFQVGQVVTVSFDVQGSRYKDKDGVEKIFTRVQPYKIEERQIRQAAPQQSAQRAVNDWIRPAQPAAQPQSPYNPNPEGGLPF